MEIPSSDDGVRRGTTLAATTFDPDVLEVTIDSTRAVLWMFVIGLNGLVFALTIAESWPTTIGIIAVSALLIGIIKARAVSTVHVIDRRFGRIVIAKRKGKRDLIREEIPTRFVRDIVLEQSTKKRTSSGDNTPFEVAVYRVAYEMQDGTRRPWTSHYSEFSDDDHALVASVRAALGLEPRPATAAPDHPTLPI
jgi:hypothetical protein